MRALKRKRRDNAHIDAAYRSHYRAESIAAWAEGQCNFAAAHVLLQAADMGLGSCPIGGFDAAALTAALSLPSGETPALAIALGHCDYAAPKQLCRQEASCLKQRDDVSTRTWR